MSKPHELLVTAQGLKKMKEDLQVLKTVKRKEVAERLKDAISYGDLSENSEYQEAKEQQAFLEGEIIQLDAKIKTAKVAKDDKSTASIHIGSKVELEIAGAKTEKFTIVGATEADPFAHKISNESPAGSALIGAKKGETVEVLQGDRTIAYKVVKIS